MHPSSVPSDTAAAGVRSKLTIEPAAAELRRMSLWLQAQARAAALGEQVAYSLEVCANEAVTNIIEHSRGHPPALPIHLCFVADDREFSLSIEDRALPFDPIAAQVPAPPTDLDRAAPGGLGLVLIRGLLPASRYVREGDRNVLMLRGTLR
jgi:serine/threonine-protein kinase RsbW